jgi:hypothetical protein
MQALSELVSAPQSSLVFSKLFHPSDVAEWVTLLHPPLPVIIPTFSEMRVLDLSRQGMDIDQLAALRDCLLSVPQVRTLKLCFNIPSENTFPTTLVSQILCAFENLQQLFLKHRDVRNCSIQDANSLYFGKMLKSSPWLRVLDVSKLINLDLPCPPMRNNIQREDARQKVQHFASVVAEARHDSLRLNRIQIRVADFVAESWAGINNLNGVLFVGV